jgi:hypothetical protein
MQLPAIIKTFGDTNPIIQVGNDPHGQWGGGRGLRMPGHHSYNETRDRYP